MEVLSSYVRFHRGRHFVGSHHDVFAQLSEGDVAPSGVIIVVRHHFNLNIQSRVVSGTISPNFTSQLIQLDFEPLMNLNKK